MKLSLVTCTCDRPEAFALCERWMSRQTLAPLEWLVLDDGEKPIVPTRGQQHFRLPECRGPLSMLRKLQWLFNHQDQVRGDAIVFIEDDDWYHPEYLERVNARLLMADVIGEGRAIYYNVEDRWWFIHSNMEHASLCSTAIHRDEWKHAALVLSAGTNNFIDMKLWRYFRQNGIGQVFDPNEGGRFTIGIKGMPGKRGYGVGHKRTMKPGGDDPTKTIVFDREWVKLRSLLGADAQSYIDLFPGSASRGRRIDVHIITYNEEEILPYTLRHYQTFARSIHIHIYPKEVLYPFRWDQKPDRSFLTDRTISIHWWEGSWMPLHQRFATATGKFDEPSTQ